MEVQDTIYKNCLDNADRSKLAISYLVYYSSLSICQSRPLLSYVELKCHIKIDCKIMIYSRSKIGTIKTDTRRFWRRYIANKDLAFFFIMRSTEFFTRGKKGGRNIKGISQPVCAEQKNSTIPNCRGNSPARYGRIMSLLFLAYVSRLHTCE